MAKNIYISLSMKCQFC